MKAVVVINKKISDLKYKKIITHVIEQIGPKLVFCYEKRVLVRLRRSRRKYSKMYII